MFNKKLLKRIEELEKQVFIPQKKVLKFVNKSPNQNPYYAKAGDSGFDLRAWIDSNTEGVQFDNEKNEYYIEIQPNEIKLIHTGLYLDIPEYCEIQVRPRSGYALKVGITVNNAPGTCDQLYTGEIGVICLNPTKKPVRITNNDKVAQAVLCPVYSQLLVDLVQVDKIEKESERGENGFGSTGM
jgi:dUTP pyrophosphatase